MYHLADLAVHDGVQLTVLGLGGAALRHDSHLLGLLDLPHARGPRTVRVVRSVSARGRGINLGEWQTAPALASAVWGVGCGVWHGHCEATLAGWCAPVQVLILDGLQPVMLFRLPKCVIEKESIRSLRPAG